MSVSTESLELNEDKTLIAKILELENQGLFKQEIVTKLGINKGIQRKFFDTRTRIDNLMNFSNSVSDLIVECPLVTTAKNLAKYLEVRTQKFLTKSKEVHGDRYDYSKVEYVSAFKKVTIICPVHGEFNQIPNNHRKGMGCNKCGRKIVDLKTVLERFRKVHGDTYDYSKVQLTYEKKRGGRTQVHSKLKIICREHGEFEQTMVLHLACKTPCPVCRNEPNKKLKSIITGYQKIREHKFDYSQTEYVGHTKYIKVVCKEHGEFKVIASKHKEGRIGCKDCKEIIRLRSDCRKIKITDDVINKIQRMKMDGLSGLKIMKITGLSKYVVYKYVKGL